MPDPSPSDLQGVPDSVFAHTAKRREYNRHPLLDLFPRIPPDALERVLDLCIAKDLVYNLSESKRYNALRYTSIVIAHVRHRRTDYDRYLAEEALERFAARKKSAEQAWRVLKEWCPWADSNPVLERCFRNTLLRPEERDPEWDPMDVDIDEDEGGDGDEGKGEGEEGRGIAGGEVVGDPMDLD